MNTPENPNCKFICKDRYIRKLADGSIDVIDGNQKSIISGHRYTDLLYLDGYFIVSQNGLKGICNINGKELLSCIYENVFSLRNNHQRYFSIKKNGQYGLFDAVDGNIVVECMSAKPITINEFKHSGRYEAIATIPRMIFGLIPWTPKLEHFKLKK